MYLGYQLLSPLGVLLCKSYDFLAFSPANLGLGIGFLQSALVITSCISAFQLLVFVFSSPILLA